MNLEKVSRDDWIVGGLALLLVIALLFFPWISVSIGPFSATSAGSGCLLIRLGVDLAKELKTCRAYSMTFLKATGISCVLR